MPNRLTLLYSKIHYKEENYLKVRTAAFKYITPSIVKVEYIGTLVHLVYYIPNIPMFLCSELLLYITYMTRLPLILWFYWFHQFRILYTDPNPI